MNLIINFKIIHFLMELLPSNMDNSIIRVY